MNARAVNLRQLLFLGGLLLLVFLMMDFNSRMDALNRLSDQERLVSARATALVGTQESLKTEIAYASSDQAVEEWARVEAHMIRPGDNPVAPIAPEGGAPPPTPAPLTVVEPVNNWQAWMLLFFDEELD